MAWSEEDLAFFKRIGQEVPKENEDTNKATTKEKKEE
jgi:hypothetical protein